MNNIIINEDWPDQFNARYEFNLSSNSVDKQAIGYLKNIGLYIKILSSIFKSKFYY